MSNIRVVDVNIEEGNVNEAIPEVKNEEVKEEPVVETKPEIKNDIIEDAQQSLVSIRDTKEEVKEEVKEKPKRQTQKDKIQCPKCLKQVSIKTYKYSHENLCKGNLAERPVKPHTKPKAKPNLPEPEDIQTSPQLSINPPMSEKPPTPSEKPTPQPIHQINPLMSHYQLLQQQYMQQKQERFNNLFQGMISGSRKKR